MSGEYAYIELCKKIMSEGVLREDRTGTGTLSIFGAQMRFQLSRDAFPLLTTKRVFWKGVVHELLWFISGSTNANDLTEKGVHIWDDHGSKEYLNTIDPNRVQGDLGPVYGFQWRHFGATYVDMHADYKNQGKDQLEEIIHMIKTDPNSRRIIMCAWNPSDLGEMALPPCHVLSQFYVSNGKLSCQLYQRSADMGLGVPFNIASYSLLTFMLAILCDLDVGDFIHTIGDAHIYTNHLEPLKEQMERMPRPFPKLVMRRKVEKIDDFKFDDFELVDYNPHASIKMKMAI